VLAVGEGLLLYTDGLVARRDVELHERLDALAAAAATAEDDPEQLLDRLLEVMDVAAERNDDVALIALERVAALGATTFEVHDADGLADARDRLRDWLRAVDADEDTVDGVVLAVSEALINAIEHGGAGEDDAHAWVQATAFADRMRIVVRDSGRWRRQGPARARGHGLRIIRALMDNVVLDPTAAGTRLELQRRIVR
jgi:anti-sigma regulatory factor (Ser/Thr protein kinase)